jgi:predicted adenine nucleotide alpha hydrolase (AANH) superfamily ATPase
MDSEAFIYVTLVVERKPKTKLELVRELRLYQYIYCKCAYPLEFQCPIT